MPPSRWLWTPRPPAPCWRSGSWSGEVLRTDFTVREENGILVVTLLAECREQIGRVVEFEGQVGHILPGAGT